MLRFSIARLLAVLCLTLGLATPGGAQQADRIDVIASFSILADLVKQVGGERVQVTALVGENSDAHVYQPKPADVARIGKAKLMIINGLGFESWADRLVRSAKFQGERLVASRGVKALKVRNAIDPHAWQDPENVKIYVTNIRDSLSKIDAAGASAYAANATAFLGEIDKLDKEIKAAWAPIPREQRRVITSHDSFAYYADAFDVIFLSPQGVSTESEPSARDVATLVRQIKQEKAKAVFIENMSSRRLIESISADTGAKVGGTLYSDALGGEVKTWLDMMRHNTRLLTQALR
jgi:zinc/manganese transport system substrate-binding protein